METMRELLIAVELTGAWLMLYPHRQGRLLRGNRISVRREKFVVKYCSDTARIAKWNRAANRETGGI